MSKKLTKIGLVVLAFLFVLSFSSCFAQTKTDDTASSYQKAKNEWQTLKDSLKNKGKKVTVDEKSQGLEKAKAMVLKAIDKAVARLQKIIQRIKKTKVITEERKEKLITDLEAQITTLETLKTKVSAATTKDELKAAVGDVKNKFIEIREIVKKIVAEILASHIDKMIDKLNTVVSKLETEIADLKAQGQGVTDFEKTLTEAETLLASTSEKNKAGDWKEARKLAEQARSKLAKLAGEIKAEKAKLKGGTSE